jgi:hypothetical protein
MPLRSTATKNKTFPTAAAIAKKCWRPSGGASSSSTPHVRTRTVIAAASASKISSSATTISVTCAAVCERFGFPPGAHLATVTQKPVTCWAVHARAAPNSPTHWSSSGRSGHRSDVIFGTTAA